MCIRDSYDGLYLPMMVLGYVFSVPFFLLTVRTSQKKGQKASLMRYVSVALICYIGVLVLLLLWGKGDAFTLSLMSDGKVSINVYTILFIALFGIGYGAYYATADMPIPMVADCSDYETYRSGKYIPGIMGTLFSLVDKLVSSLSATVVGIAVTFIGLNKTSKGEWKEGYDYLEKAITAEDSHDFALPSLYANAALCLHKMGKKRKAHQYCKKAYDLAPEEIDPYLIEGRIYMEEGEYEKGVKKWAKALEYAPYADTWHEIGMCSMEIGQLSYAKLAFEHVKEMEPDFEGINERLTSLYMLLKDKENFMKYNQLCEHPFRLEELDRLQQILQEDNQEELALVMKNIFNALQ